MVIFRESKWPKIIKTHDVVRVSVGDQHGIQLADPVPEKLPPEIRTGVHDPAAFRSANVDRRAVALIPGVGGATYRAVAPDNRHAQGGAGAEKSKFQLSHARGSPTLLLVEVKAKCQRFSLFICRVPSFIHHAHHSID